jgi:hypothetical protein
LIALIGPERTGGRNRFPRAAPRGADRHQAPRAQQADVGDGGGNAERGQAGVDGQLGGAGDERADRKGQAPPRERERHATPCRAHRQRSGQADPQHHETPYRDSEQDGEDVHAVGLMGFDRQGGVGSE